VVKKGSLTLASPQVVAWVKDVEGADLNPRTLASWAAKGIAVPSFWPKKKGRYNVRHYTLEDLARVRLVVRLRKQHLSMAKVLSILAYLDRELRDALKPKTKSVLIVDGWRGRLTVRRPGRPDVEAPSGQTVLPLADVVKGNEAAARRAVGGT